jgi:putative ABC transport system permease protein
MKMLLKIAFRNVFRNRRRTGINIMMIAGAIAAIVIFKGFSHNLLSRLEDVAVNAQYGHLQIASEKTWNLSANDKPRDRLIAVDPTLKEKIVKIPKVAYMSGRLSFFGLVNTGDQSLSARGLGFDPGVETKMRDQLEIIEGRNLTADSKFEVILGSGLREQLGAKVGDQLTLLSYTFDGAVNAIDAECVGIFRSGLTEVDSTTYMLPLAMSQKLMDTASIERWVIQLDSTDSTDEVRAQVAKLTGAGTSVRTWLNLADYYRQINSYFQKQNGIIDWILMLLALLAIGNTVGMSVAERMGEIGTLRALGDNRKDIITQFLVEGLILGGIGGLAGVTLGMTIAKILTSLELPITPPGASMDVPIVIDLIPSAFQSAFAMMCLMAVAATLLPAFRASQLKIVEALRRNI